MNESIEVLVSKLFYENERIGYDGKFIDISDHFQKMDIQSWDSSRPDSHSPAAIFTDHTHKKGGIMLGYKINLMSRKDNFNGNVLFTQDQITQFYNLHVISQSSINHLFEVMYGLNDNVTISSR